MERQLYYLQQLAPQHVVLAVFFENAELKEYAVRRPRVSEDYFKQVSAEKFIYEKRYVTIIITIAFFRFVSLHSIFRPFRRESCL